VKPRGRAAKKNLTPLGATSEMTGTPAVTSSLSGTVDAVKRWFQRHSDNLQSSKSLTDKLKFVVEDGYVWMLAALIFVLYTLYKREKLVRRAGLTTETSV
jgi:hypothetical protein